jgi:hypothetical protein
MTAGGDEQIADERRNKVLNGLKTKFTQHRELEAEVKKRNVSI